MHLPRSLTTLETAEAIRKCSPEQWTLTPDECASRDTILPPPPPLWDAAAAAEWATQKQGRKVAAVHWPGYVRHPWSGYSLAEAGRFATENTGNLVWMLAARSLIGYGAAQVDWGKATRNADAQLFAQANLLRELPAGCKSRYESCPGSNQAEVAKISRNIRSLDAASRPMPTLMVGIGAQASLLVRPESFRLDNVSLGLLHEVAARGEISVRGRFTAEAIWSNGGPRTYVAGCPSLFLNKRPDLGQVLEAQYKALSQLAEQRPLKFAVSMPSASSLAHRADLAFQLARLVVEHPGSMVVVQDQGSYDQLRKLGREAGIPNGWLPYEAVRHFYDIQSWTEALRAVDFVLSPRLASTSLKPTGGADSFPFAIRVYLSPPASRHRIHGSMMALAAEKPAIAIATDSRMSEIAEASRLPYINVSLQFEQTNISLKSPLNMVWYRFPHPEGPRPGIDWRQIISQVGFLIA